MRYLKTKLRAISREYLKRDRELIIARAGGKCTICSRKHGDTFLFGPTNYLKQQIKFAVRMDIHVIDSAILGQKLTVLCSGCHLSYHLFNRLSEGAMLGDKKLNETLYRRCARCKELNCMCCKKCNKLAKWCLCSAKKLIVARKKRSAIKRRTKTAETKRIKLRSNRRA